MMKALIFTSLFFLFLYQSIKAQGLLFDTTAYSKMDTVLSYTKGKDAWPQKSSLRAYCPSPRDQKQVKSCVAWAMGYGGISMVMAIREKCTDLDYINKNAYSAKFIYSQVNPNANAQQGMTFNDAIDFLQVHGDCYSHQFEFDSYSLSKKKPSESLKVLAKGNTLSQAKALFKKTATAEQRIDQTKGSLHNNQPVIVGMQYLAKSKPSISSNATFLNFDSTSGIGGHALVVIGYNNNMAAFEVMNSWGKNWGDEGFGWISYEDYGHYCQEAYVLELGKEEQQLVMEISGKDIIKDQALCLKYSPPFIGLWAEKNKALKFSLLLSHISVDAYLYLFWFEGNGKLARITSFQQGKPTGCPNASIELPSHESVFQEEYSGIDYVCVLYSLSPITDFEKKIETKKNILKDDIYEGLRSLFCEKLKLPALLEYLPTDNQLWIEAKPLKKDAIIPLIFRLED